MTSAIGNAMPITTNNLPYNAEKSVAKASPLQQKWKFVKIININIIIYKQLLAKQSFGFILYQTVDSVTGLCGSERLYESGNI